MRLLYVWTWGETNVFRVTALCQTFHIQHLMESIGNGMGVEADRAWGRANSLTISPPTAFGSLVIKNKTGVGGT